MWKTVKKHKQLVAQILFAIKVGFLILIKLFQLKSFHIGGLLRKPVTELKWLKPPFAL